MADFDPYFKWLAIPPEEQPPNHYRLLGLPIFVDDLDVIEGAAEQRTIYLRTFQTGPNSELAERLLNEVSAARVCLLTAEDKAEYDKRLQSTSEPGQPVVVEDTSAKEKDWSFATVKLPDDKDRRLVEPEQLPPLDTDPLAGFPADLAPHANNVNDLKRSLGNRPKTFWQEPWAIPAAAGGVVVAVLLLMLLTSGGDPSSPSDKPEIADKQNGTDTSQQDEDRQAKIAADKVAAAPVLTLKGHSAALNSVAFSPDGKQIVSGSSDTTVKVWNARTGQEVVTLIGHSREVQTVAFSPDGKRVVSSNWDRTVKVWNVENGREIVTFKGHSAPVKSAAFSPDGKRVVSGSWDNTAKIWDASTGRELVVIRGHLATVYSVAFSPDGKRIASGSRDRTVKLWHASNGREISTLKGHTGVVNSVAFSPDGKRIASGSWDGTIKVWDSSTGREISTLKGHLDVVNAVAFSPDGKRIVSVSRDKTVKVWDASTRREINTLTGHSDNVYGVAFNPDGKQIVTGSYDKTVKVWNLEANGLAPAKPVAEELPGSLKQGLVAYYPFDGDANDESGGGHDGKVEGAILGVDRFGNTGKAYHFDGSDDVVKIAPLNSTAFDAISISLWVRTTNKQRHKHLFSTYGTEQQHWFNVLLSGSGNDGRCSAQIDGGFDPPPHCSTTESIADDQWHHVVACWDRVTGKMKIYLEGRKNVELATPIKAKLNLTVPIWIGGQEEFPSRHFEGMIDDIRIYSRALSEAEVRSLYEFEKP